MGTRAELGWFAEVLASVGLLQPGQSVLAATVSRPRPQAECVLCHTPCGPGSAWIVSRSPLHPPRSRKGPYDLDQLAQGGNAEPRHQRKRKRMPNVRDTVVICKRCADPSGTPTTRRPAVTCVECCSNRDKINQELARQAAEGRVTGYSCPVCKTWHLQPWPLGTVQGDDSDA